MEYNWEDKMRLVDSLCGPIAESPSLRISKSGWMMFAPGLRMVDDRPQEPTMETILPISGRAQPKFLNRIEYLGRALSISSVTIVILLT